MDCQFKGNLPSSGVYLAYREGGRVEPSREKTEDGEEMMLEASSHQSQFFQQKLDQLAKKCGQLSQILHDTRTTLAMRNFGENLESLTDENLDFLLNSIKQEKSQRDKNHHELQLIIAEVECTFEEVKVDLIDRFEEVLTQIKREKATSKHPSDLVTLAGELEFREHLFSQFLNQKQDYLQLSKIINEIEQSEQFFRKQIYSCKKQRSAISAMNQIHQEGKEKRQRILQDATQACAKISQQAQHEQEALAEGYQINTFLTIISQKGALDEREWKSPIMREIFFAVSQKVRQNSSQIPISLLQELAEVDIFSENEQTIQWLLDIQGKL